MKQLSSDSHNKATIKKRITDLLDASERIESLGGAYVLEKPEISENWLVTPEGVMLRKICGHKRMAGPCFLPSGWGTKHLGKGKCKKHGRSLLYNPQLNQLEGIPARFGELLEHVDGIEDGILLNVDHEIKFLYALQQYVLTMGETSQLSLPQIELLRDFTNDLVKTKAIKNKIQKEIRLDHSTVRDFVKSIFDIIVQRVQGAEAQNILQDIYNQVIVPYQNNDKISGSGFDMKEQIQKTIDKAKQK